MIPMWNQFWKRWIPTSEVALQQAEEEILSKYVSPDVRQRFTRRRICLPSFAKAHGADTNEYCINTLDSGWRHEPGEGEEIVLAHGFGSGWGFWFRNIESLYGMDRVGRVMAFDWMGMGGSSRPRFTPLRTSCTSKLPSDVQEAENFFIDSLHEWQTIMGLKKITLVGHSLGGYLSTCYALKYPEKVKQLILVSPVGFPEIPKGGISHPDPKISVQNGMSELEEGRIPLLLNDPPNVEVDAVVKEEQELLEDKEKVTHVKSTTLTEKDVSVKMSWQMQMILRAWHSNFTPQAIVRLMGPYGYNSVVNTVKRRFAASLGEEEANILADYLYHITASPPSGEYAMNALLAPVVVDGRPVGVFARSPLIPRLKEFTNSSDTAGKLPPVLLLFGDHDWMFHPSLREPWTKELKQADVRLVVIPHAGHHLYLDNAEFFHQVLAQYLLRER